MSQTYKVILPKEQEVKLEDKSLSIFLKHIKDNYVDLQAVHVKNEGSRSRAKAARNNAKGGIKGIADIIILGSPTLVIELKSENIKANVTEDQIIFLNKAAKWGCDCYICYGHLAAIEALDNWIKKNYNH